MAMQPTASGERRLSARFLAVGIVFSVLCIAFLIVLAVIQLRGSSLPPKTEGYIRTYTVPGARGEIYDCHGNLLVGNSQRYDLIYEYGAMPDTRREVNQTLLSAMDAILETGNGDKLADDYFILEGTYPKMKFVSELSDKESSERYYYERFLDRKEFEEEETDADVVMNYFVKRYQLSKSYYSNEEITSLIRLYYEMERVDFGQYQSYTLAEDVNMALITRLEESNIEGVNFRVQEAREYLYPGVASHILGRLGKITAETAEQYIALGYPLDALVGTSGCELAFEEWLRGQDGVMVIRYDKNGRQIEKYYETEPVRGNDVYLTIDIDLQRAAEEALAEEVDGLTGARGGAVTVMDPNTGKALALASYPTYDLTQFDSASYVEALNQNPNNPWLNRALRGIYPPGSTYKVGAALAGLETGAINRSSTYVCEKVFPHYDHPTCLGTHGSTNVIGALRDSCNIFFYYLGDLMGVDSMTSYTTRLGLGVSTGLELSDGAGTVATESVNPGDIIRAAIGQSDHGYTPLQLSVYMSSIVNGGTRYQVHLLDSVRKYYTGEIVYQPSVQVLDQVDFSKNTYDILIEGMRQVISESGTLQYYFSDVGVTVGGKTGTAQVTGKKDYALFSGFAPLDDPEIVASCIIEEGVSGINAAYVISRVMEKYFHATVEPS